MSLRCSGGGVGSTTSVVLVVAGVGFGPLRVGTALVVSGCCISVTCSSDCLFFDCSLVVVVTFASVVVDCFLVVQSTIQGSSVGTFGFSVDAVVVVVVFVSAAVVVTGALGVVELVSTVLTGVVTSVVVEETSPVVFRSQDPAEQVAQLIDLAPFSAQPSQKNESS